MRKSSLSQPPTRTPTRRKLTLLITAEEKDWVKHAASLKRQTLDDYVRRAINASLLREGVDAVLLHQKDWP